MERFGHHSLSLTWRGSVTREGILLSLGTDSSLPKVILAYNFKVLPVLIHRILRWHFQLLTFTLQGDLGCCRCCWGLSSWCSTGELCWAPLITSTPSPAMVNTDDNKINVDDNNVSTDIIMVNIKRFWSFSFFIGQGLQSISFSIPIRKCQHPQVEREILVLTCTAISPDIGSFLSFLNLITNKRMLK